MVSIAGLPAAYNNIPRRERMKAGCRAALLAGLLFFIGAVPVLAAESEYETDQVILSWSFDNARSQTITWHSKDAGNGYVQYAQYGKEGQALSRTRQVKASAREAEDTTVVRRS